MKKFNIENIKEFTKKLNQKHLILFFLFMGFLVLLHNNSQVTEEISDSHSELPTVDTLIPLGFVLVPVEITNINSLNGLLSTTGVVDLYFNEAGKSIKVGSRLKVIQAPNNPSMYAVLVKESESSMVLNYPGPFIAAIQNNQVQDGNVLQKSKSNNKKFIIETTF